MKKWLLVASVIVIVVVAGAAGLAYFYNQKNSLAPSSINPASGLGQIKEVSGYNDGNFLYSCSKKIKAKKVEVAGPSVTGDVSKKYYGYEPIDKDEARLLCHSTGVIENKGKIKVLQRQDVAQLIDRYGYKDLSIKALEFKYIKDPEFVHRLLPSYKAQQIGCIIILFTPGDDVVFLENEKLNVFEKVEYKKFQQDIDHASAADKKTFYDNLQ